MSKASFIGKPLKGVSSVVPSIQTPITASVVNSISQGTVNLGNVSISGGTIDQTTIGANGQGPGYFSYLQTGLPTGPGGAVNFYGTNIGDYASWIPNSGIWDIHGGLNVRDTSKFGNLQLFGNTVTATNTNGSINFQPNGTGQVTIGGPFVQSTTFGNVSLATSVGTVTLLAYSNASLSSTNGTLNLLGGTGIVQNTNNGDISLKTGNSLPVSQISVITTGTGTVQISTTQNHNFVAGQQIIFTNTNSTPNVNGLNSVLSVISPRLFTVGVKTPVTVAGTSGNVRPTNNINLNATDYINIPYNVALDFGSTCNGIQSDTSDNLTVSSCGNISLKPKGNVIIPESTQLLFGSTSTSISSSGGTLVLKGDTNIDGNLTISGTQTVINTQQVYSKDPVIVVGGTSTSTVTTNDTMDRGIAFDYGTGSAAKTGFFGWQRNSNSFVYIPDASITNNIVTGSAGNASFGSLSTNSLAIGIGGLSTTSIQGNPDLILSERNLFLSATGYVSIPNNIQLKFGTTGTLISENTSQNLNIVAQGGNIIIPQNTFLTFNGSVGSSAVSISSSGTELTVSASNYISLLSSSGVKVNKNTPVVFSTDLSSNILSDNLNNLVLSSGNNVVLTPTSGQIIVPTTSSINFGNTSSQISSSSGNLSMISSGNTTVNGGTKVTISTTSGDIALSPSGNVSLPYTKLLTFGNTTNSISSSVTSVNVSSVGNIVLAPATNVLISNSKCLLFGASTETICPVSGSLQISTSQNILLNPTGYVGLPYNVNLEWGNNSSYSVTASTGNGLSVNSGGDIKLLAATQVFVPKNIPIKFGSSTESIGSDTSNNLFLNTQGNLTLTSSTGGINLLPTTNIFVKKLIPVQIGSTTESISGDGSGSLQVSAGTSTFLTSPIFNVVSSSTNFTDNIPSVGGISTSSTDNGKDKGIKFFWNNGTTSKLGFFGFKRNTQKFTFIPDGTNNNDVFTGAAGNLDISGLTATSINLSGGGLTSVSSISNSGTLQISAPQIILPDQTPLQFGNSTRSIYSDGTNLNISSVSGQLQVASNTLFQQSVTVNGTLTVKGIAPTYTTVEYVTCPTGVTTSLDWSKSISFVTVTGISGNIATSIATPSPGAAFKTVVITAMASGTKFQLQFNGAQNSRFRNPGSGDISSDSILTFDTPGQSVMLLYDVVNGYFLNPQSGAYLT